MLTTQAVREAIATESEAAWLYLLTISDPNGVDPDLNLVNNNESVVSNGVTYEPYPFEVELSPDDGERAIDVKLRLMHLGGGVAKAMHHLRASPVITIRIVLSVAPDNVEREITNAALATVSWDAMEVVAVLRLVDTMDAQCPAPFYGAHEFPGLFT